jgi:hypothetical protein|tara:strand:+ start:405 stop:701 length:297 start_codon:yes stop_codon:yes gene_type:complete
MKFKVKDKELNIEPATLRKIAELEKSAGSITDMGKEKPIDSIIKIVTVALESSPQDEGVTIDWLLDNVGMGEMTVLNDIVTHFLGVNPAEITENSSNS